MRTRALALFAVFAACLAACSAPKYAWYKSVSDDWGADVPWGWNVIADADHDAFAQVNFIGPFDPDFYLGVPSLSVRWYRNYRPHQMRNGQLEMYADADDFINQMLRQVYGPKYDLLGSAAPGKRRPDIVKPETIVLEASGLEAKYFGVISPTPAAPGSHWGVYKDPDGRLVNAREHDYAVVPMAGGFYVFCYPATVRGHDKGVELFNALINTFHPYTDGPGGPKIKIRPVETKRSS